MKIDLIGRIGDNGGVGNYSTQLYYQLKDDGMRVRKVVPQLRLPILQSTAQNFVEIPLKVLFSNADIVHLTDQEQASGLAFFPRRLLNNVVVTVHDISPYINDYAGPISQIVSSFYCHALRKVPKIIAISEFTKSELIDNLDIPEQRIDVIYQGVNTDFFHPRDLEEKILEKYGITRPYILYVGSEIDRKNMRGVLEKFQEFQKENPELTLVKVGSAGRKKYREKTLCYMDELGLQDGEDVIFTGFVAQEDLPQIYSSAEKTILWSHYEGFGRSALESEACGTPVITKNERPMKEWLPPERFSVDGELSFCIPERFNWSETANETIKVYQDIF